MKKKHIALTLTSMLLLFIVGGYQNCGDDSYRMVNQVKSVNSADGSDGDGGDGYAPEIKKDRLILRFFQPKSMNLMSSMMDDPEEPVAQNGEAGYSEARTAGQQLFAKPTVEDFSEPAACFGLVAGGGDCGKGGNDDKILAKLDNNPTVADLQNSAEVLASQVRNGEDTSKATEKIGKALEGLVKGTDGKENQNLTVLNTVDTLTEGKKWDLATSGDGKVLTVKASATLPSELVGGAGATATVEGNAKYTNSGNLLEGRFANGVSGEATIHLPNSAEDHRVVPSQIVTDVEVATGKTEEELSQVPTPGSKTGDTSIPEGAEGISAKVRVNKFSADNQERVDKLTKAVLDHADAKEDYEKRKDSHTCYDCSRRADDLVKDQQKIESLRQDLEKNIGVRVAKQGENTALSAAHDQLPEMARKNLPEHAITKWDAEATGRNVKGTGVDFNAQAEGGAFGATASGSATKEGVGSANFRAQTSDYNRVDAQVDADSQYGKAHADISANVREKTAQYDIQASGKGELAGANVRTSGMADAEGNVAGKFTASDRNHGVRTQGTYAANVNEKVAIVNSDVVHDGTGVKGNVTAGVNLKTGNAVAYGNGTYQGLNVDAAAAVAPNANGDFGSAEAGVRIQGEMPEAMKQAIDNAFQATADGIVGVSNGLVAIHEGAKTVGETVNAGLSGLQKGAQAMKDFSDSANRFLGGGSTEPAPPPPEDTRSTWEKATDYVSDTVDTTKKYAGYASATAKFLAPGIEKAWQREVTDPIKNTVNEAKASVSNYISSASQSIKEFAFGKSEDPVAEVAEYQNKVENIAAAKAVESQLNQVEKVVAHTEDQKAVEALSAPPLPNPSPRRIEAAPLPNPSPRRVGGSVPLPSPSPRRVGSAPVPTPSPRRVANLVQGAEEEPGIDISSLAVCFQSEAYFLAGNIIMYLSNGVDRCGDVVTVMAQEPNSNEMVNISAAFRHLGEFTQENGAHWVIRKIEWIEAGNENRQAIKSLANLKVYPDVIESNALLLRAVSAIRAKSLPFARYVASVQCALMMEEGYDYEKICEEVKNLYAWEVIQSAQYTKYLQNLQINLDFLKEGN